MCLMGVGHQEAGAQVLALVNLEGLAAELMQKHCQNDSQASLSLSILEIKGLRPRKGSHSTNATLHVIPSTCIDRRLVSTNAERLHTSCGPVLIALYHKYCLVMMIVRALVHVSY